MFPKVSVGAQIIRELIWEEVKRVAPKPKDLTPSTNSDCSFVCYINDGRGDLKSCGTIIRMVSIICIARKLKADLTSSILSALPTTTTTFPAASLKTTLIL